MSNLDLAITLRLRNLISAGAKAVRGDLKGMREEISKLGTAKGAGQLAGDLKKVEGAATAARSDLAGMRAEAGKLAAAADSARRLARDVRGVGSAATSVRSDIAGMRAEANRIAGSAAAKQLARDLHGIGTEADRSAAAMERMRRIGANLRRGRPMYDGVERKSQPAGGGALVAGSRSMIGGVLGGYAVAEGYKQAAQFDRRMTMIGQTADAARAQIDSLGASVHDLAQQTATPVDKLAGGLEALVAQGRNLKEALDFLPSVVRTAAATGSEVDDIAKSADSVSSNFAISAKEMQAAFDIMAAGGKAGQFELKDMARYLPSLAPAAKAAGFAGQKGLADIVAMLQVIRKGSGSAEEAATSMTNVFTKLESDETVKNFKEMGVDLEAAMKKGRKEGRNLVEVLEEATAKATKGDLSLLPKLFKDQEFARGMRALMTYRGEWQKLSGTVQDGSAGTVMRDLDRVTKDAQASLDRLSNSWTRFMQAASRLADAGGISKGLGDTAKEFQSVAEALERINKAYAEGGLSEAIKQMTGDAADRLRENRKAWLEEHGKREDGRIAELEADNKAFREKLERENYSPESIAKTMRKREEAVEKARRRRAGIERAKQDPALAERKPLRMGVDPTAPIQGQTEAIGRGEGSKHSSAFNEAFPVDLSPRRVLPPGTPLPPRRPDSMPRGIGSVDEVLGPDARGAPSEPVKPAPPGAGPQTAAPVAEPARIADATAALAAYRNELAGIKSQLDGLAASGEAATSPATAGLEARKAELEQLIASLRDLSAEGQKAGQSFATGLTAGGAEAKAAAGNTASGVKAALAVDAAAEGQNVGASYARGVAAGGAQAVRAAQTMAARVRAAYRGIGPMPGIGGGPSGPLQARGRGGPRAPTQQRAGGGRAAPGQPGSRPFDPGASEGRMRSASIPNIPPAGVEQLRQVSLIEPTQPAAVGLGGGVGRGGGAGGGVGAGRGGAGNVTNNINAPITVSGAGDPDAVARRVGRELASAIDRTRSGALHDGTMI